MGPRWLRPQAQCAGVVSDGACVAHASGQEAWDFDLLADAALYTSVIAQERVYLVVWMDDIPSAVLEIGYLVCAISCVTSTRVQRYG